MLKAQRAWWGLSMARDARILHSLRFASSCNSVSVIASCSSASQLPRQRIPQASEKAVLTITLRGGYVATHYKEVLNDQRY